MRHIPTELQRAVRQRASERCEYCGLSQEGQEATFHIDHVRPVMAGGETALENLALACVSCSLRKGARQRGIDPATGEEVLIFNPRLEGFTRHFRWDGIYLIGLTATGRATVAVLDLNRRTLLLIRAEGMAAGRHPPPQEWLDRSME